MSLEKVLIGGEWREADASGQFQADNPATKEPLAAAYPVSSWNDCDAALTAAVDAQMGMEKALSALAAGLGGANMIYESSGMMASLLGASFEAFVADDEMLSHVQRAIRGIEVSEETLGFETIREAVAGEGHFLGAPQTMAAMQRDYFYPSLADRSDPKAWAEAGAGDLWTRARRRADEILTTHFPAYIEPATDRGLRERFNILLPLERMRAG